MSKKSCTFLPKKGRTLMLELKKEFGYDVAKNAFLKGAKKTKTVAVKGENGVFGREKRDF